jgi:prepilin peptidase CpaA
MTQSIFLAFPALMVFAGSYDLLSLTISNRLCLAVAALFFPAALLAGMDPIHIALHLSCALAMLCAGFALFAAGLIGGGDAKLFAAAALWFGWAQIADYAITVALLGGGLAIAGLALQTLRCLYPAAGLLLPERPSLPYGIALGLAALLLFPHSAWMAQ